MPAPHPAPQIPLRVATSCALVPMLLGSLSFFGWLMLSGGKSDEGEAFVMLGAGTLGAGTLLFPLGLGALLVARRRGAQLRAVGTRAALLLGNLPLALLFLIGTNLAAIQRVEVVNHSGAPIEELVLVASRVEKVMASPLGPEARDVWRFKPRSEGVLNFTGRQGDTRVQGDNLCMFFIFDRKDVVLEFTGIGEWNVTETPGAPWSFLPWR
ncbi:MAG: hypothetical protein P8R46_06995 [Planctomycetota bacterium]|nr:hypothetical protein [Planctomycetota bacterium]